MLKKFEFSHFFPVLIGLKSAKHCPTNLERCAILIYILHSVPCMKIAYFFDHKRKWRNDLESFFYKHGIKKNVGKYDWRFLQDFNWFNTKNNNCFYILCTQFLTANNSCGLTRLFLRNNQVSSQYSKHTVILEQFNIKE